MSGISIELLTFFLQTFYRYFPCNQIKLSLYLPEMCYRGGFYA